MMKLAELKEILESTGLPVAYESFPEEETPDMPFMVYWEMGSNNIYGDNVVVHTFKRIRVDLLTRYKDEQAEELIEKTLLENEIPWEKDDEMDPTEHYTKVSYEMEI